MRTIETKVYQFDELSEAAKEKAREWYRLASEFDNDFTDCVIEDARQCAEFIGITFDTKPVELMGGGTRQDPCVYWSGFSSQGDGACFEGAWRASDVKPGKLKEHAPKDTELHRIAGEFEKIAKAFPDSSFRVKHRGHYSHKYCTEFDCEPGEPGDLIDSDDFPEDKLIEAARDFMQWIYRQLEKEWEYQNSDEQVDEMIRINEYEFTESGRRFP